VQNKNTKEETKRIQTKRNEEIAEIEAATKGKKENQLSSLARKAEEGWARLPFLA